MKEKVTQRRKTGRSYKNRPFPQTRNEDLLEKLPYCCLKNHFRTLISFDQNVIK